MALQKTLMALAAGAAIMASAGAAQAQDGQIFGYWKNPKGSVHIDIRPCGARACGYVVWASPKAQEDAREGGNPNLVGMQIIRELAPIEGGVWKGKVLAPDINMTFSGTARPDGATRLRAKGCLIGGLICKSQTWTRIATPTG